MREATRVMDDECRGVRSCAPDRRRVSIAAAAVRPATCPGGAFGDPRRRGFCRILRTLARVSLPVGTIPGGRGGPKSVAPAFLPVTCRTARFRAVRAFSGRV